jgi:hypothetical protein
VKYLTWWTRVWLLSSTLGVGLGMLEWSALVTLISILIVSVVAGAVTNALRNEFLTSPGTEPGQRRLVAHSLAVGAGVVGAFAVIAASPTVGLLLVGLAAVTSLPVLARVQPRRNLSRVASTGLKSTRSGHRKTTSTGGRVAAQNTQSLPVRPVATMSVEELCTLWRSTFWQLRDETDPDRRARLVGRRQACLEELERRNPSGFAAWLDSGGRASGGPERYMRRPPDEGEPDEEA